jgi:glycosyltransferase involved in cell wall biosynthesis
VKSLIVVSQVFYPDASATSQLLFDLLKKIAAATNTQVTVICGYQVGQEFTPDDRQKSVLKAYEVYQNIHIRRCGLRLNLKKSLLNRALSYMAFLAHSAWVLLAIAAGHKNDEDAKIVGVTNPPFMPILLWVTSWLGRFQYQLLLHDIYPETLLALGKLQPSQMQVRVWRWLNQRGFARAQSIVVLGRDMGTLLVERYGVARNKIAYIPHWCVVEADMLHANNCATNNNATNVNQNIVVQYSGNMGMWHDINSIVHAAQKLQSAPVRFEMIGSGARRKAAEALSQSLGVQNMIWRNFVPKDQLTQSIGHCDIALISLREGFEGAAVPSKLYGILAAGKAIVAQVPPQSEVGLVVNENACGIVVLPNDQTGLENAIRTLIEHPTTLRKMGGNARKAYIEKYTLDHAVAAYTEWWGLN